MKTLNTISIIIIPVLVILCIFLVTRLNKQSTASDRKDSIIAEKNAEIEYRITENGKVVADKLAAQATAKEALQAYPAIVDKLQREFDVKIKDVKAFVQAGFKAQGEGSALVTNNYYADSSGREVRGRKLIFDDKYLHFETTLFDSLSNALSQYTYSDSVLMAFHVKRKWFLGKETLHASASLSNPAAKVTGMTSVLVDEAKDKRIMVGPMMGYDPFNNRWFVGVGIGYGLKKF